MKVDKVVVRHRSYEVAHYLIGLGFGIRHAFFVIFIIGIDIFDMMAVNDLLCIFRNDVRQHFVVDILKHRFDDSVILAF